MLDCRRFLMLTNDVEQRSDEQFPCWSCAFCRPPDMKMTVVSMIAVAFASLATAALGDGDDDCSHQQVTYHGPEPPNPEPFYLG